ncbi:MAG TPA: tellurite resistance/C4-dicarboxylate transporter family protein [Candidatus Lustribacter sp.]
MFRLFQLAPRYVPVGSFAIVMATGIVAVAVDEIGLTSLAKVVFDFAVLAYVVLWILFALRLWHFQRELRDGAQRYDRAPGFFAIVAATGVVGTAAASIFSIPAAYALWVATIVLWFAMTYTILPGLIISRKKPGIGAGFTGGWLLIVVATEAVAVLGAPIAREGPPANASLVLFASLCFWLVGSMIYVWLITLIFYRSVFLPLSADEWTPAYWINMGAVSIATLAGASLLKESSLCPQLNAVASFVAGGTLALWATATWWIPILIVLWLWRHVRMRVPLRYAQSIWSAVFPLGMYSVATRSLAGALGTPFLDPLADVFAWLALCAWLASVLALGWWLAHDPLKSETGVSAVNEP